MRSACVHLTALFRRLRRRAGLAQKDVADTLAIGLNTWKNYEHGVRPVPPDLIDRVCVVVQASLEERVLLYRWSLGHDPPLRHSCLAAVRARYDIGPYLESLKQHLAPERAAYIADGAWNVIAMTEAYRTQFAGPIGAHDTDHPSENTMRFILFHRDARKVLVDWHDSFRLPTLGYLSAACTSNPVDPVLCAIRRRVLEDPELAREYRNVAPRLLGIADPRLRLELRHPVWGHTGVRVLIVPAQPPLQEFGFRIVTAVPCRLQEPASEAVAGRSARP